MNQSIPHFSRANRRVLIVRLLLLITIAISSLAVPGLIKIGDTTVLAGVFPFVLSKALGVSAPTSKPADRAQLSSADASTKTRIAGQYGKLPLSFEINHGQTDGQVKFLSRGPGYDLFLTATEAVLTLRKPHSQRLDKAEASASPTLSKDDSSSRTQTTVLRLKMIGADPGALVEGRDELPGKVNYLIGDDPKNWHANIPTYGRVHYAQVYPGVDMVYYGNQMELEYDFVVSPNADPRIVKFNVDGAERLRIDNTGDLVITVDQSEVKLRKPVLYQINDQGKRNEVRGSYVLKGSEVSFKVRSYNSKKALIIDPVLSYSTYFGPAASALAITVDPSGNAYLTGSATSAIFPTTAGSLKPASTQDIPDAFVTKLNSAGTALIYSTFLGGSSLDTGRGIAVDSSGNAFVTGDTNSNNFPTVNPIRSSTSNFLTTLDAGGHWSGQFIGPANAAVNVLAVDPLTPNTIYACVGVTGGSGVYKTTDGGINWVGLNTGLTGVTCPALVIDPATPSTLYASLNSNNSSGSGLYKSVDAGATWTRLTNGLSGATLSSLAIDPSSPSTLYAGAVFSGVFKSTNGGASWANSSTGINFGGTSALAVDPANSATVYASAGGGGVFKTTNGGGNWGQVNTGLTNTNIRTLTIDAASNVYAGSSGGGLFKSTNGGGNWNPLNNGLPTFTSVTSLALNADASTMFLGVADGRIYKSVNSGANWIINYETLTSTRFNSLVMSPTNSSLLYAGAGIQFGSLPDHEGFVAKLNPDGSALIYSTYLGGNKDDSGRGISVDSAGNAYVTGQTASDTFPLVAAFQSSRKGTVDAFVTSLNAAGTALVYSTYLGGDNFDTANAIAVDGAGNAYVTGSTSSANFPLANAFQPSLAETFFTGDAFATKLSSSGALAYSTYLGGNNSDTGNGIAVDASGNAYIAGSTTSNNFPTVNPIQPTNLGGFVSKLNNLGSGLVYSTYFGNSRGIAVDSTGNAYVTGFTNSAAFPLVAGSLRTKSPFLTSNSNVSNWTNDNYGLKSEIVSVITLDPVLPSTIYAAAGNGVLKSIDGGRNWNAFNTGLVSPNVMALVVDPITPSTIYLASNSTDFSSSRGVYKSTNGGSTWSPANTGLGSGGVNALAIDPITPSTLYAGTGGGVAKSTNGGSSWTTVGLFSIDSIAIDPITPTTIYAGNSNGGGVSRSIDGGANWQPVNNGLTNTSVLSLAIDPVTPSTVYAGLNAGLFKSVNGGNNWVAINDGLPGTFIRAVSIDPVTPSTIYVTSSFNAGGVFKSVNGGNNWVPFGGALKSTFLHALAINPLNPSTVYLGIQNFPSDNDAFVTKINQSGTAFVYSTLLGGNANPFDGSGFSDEGLGIAIDTSGNAYVTGSTREPDFPTTPDSYLPIFVGRSFVSKLSNSYLIGGQVLDGSNVPVSGAEVILSEGAGLRSVLTESDGSYQFSHLPEGGNFTVTATKPHFTMSPTSHSLNNLTSNQTANFTATTTNSPFYTISGQVTDNGVPLAGVTLTLSGSQPGIRTTDSNGNYSFTLASGGNYTLTASLLGFNFTPPNQAFNNLAANQTADFVATRQDFIVINANNHGTGSLRQAMLNANATAGTDRIVFNIPGGGVHTINLLIELPEITDPVVIDATTQPGYAGAPLVELNGAAVGNNSAGFRITAGSSTIRGFVINRFNNPGFGGIFMSTNGGNVIQANYIGLNSTGTLPSSNHDGIIISTSSNNLIGGTTPATRNVISGNSFEGIILSGPNNQIMGNFIGTNAAGTAAVGNGIRGIIVSGSLLSTANNVIGGTTPGAGNLISGNQVGINGGGVSVQGNLIGTDVSGTLAVGNNTGIQAHAGALIGGTVPGARNIISGNNAGVHIQGQESKLQGNFIGTDITGTLALGNTGGGVFAGDRALIGGTTPEARNIISGNGGTGNVSLGFNIHGDNVTVQGNYIGTDVTGSVALVNPSVGISISQSGNLIGGLVPGARNIISGNLIGIQLGALTTGNVTANVVQGNFIGLDAAGNVPLPNQSDGVMFAGFSSNNTIGGSETDAGNIIAFNGGNGAFVSNGTGNSIRGNSIFSNLGLGIEISPNGVTANDPGDADTGGNNLQNFPLLTSVTSNGPPTGIQGSLHSTPNTIFRIDFYSNAACDSSGNGEGGRFFDTTTVTTDGNGNAAINFTSASSPGPDRAVTATATDPLGNTSEFSPCNSTQASGSVQFSRSSYSVLEDVGNATITVLRTGGSKGTLSVDYTSAGITATAGADYTDVSGTLIFGDGEITKTFSVPIANDGLTEPPETLRLSLSANELETLGTRATAIMTIQDSSTPLVLTPISLNVLEGDSGTTNAVVNVNLSAATGRTVTADFNTTGGSASSGSDFTAVTGSLTFAPGETVQTITIPIIGDTVSEANESFSVVLSNAVNATLANSASVTILNDPPNAVDDSLSSVLEDSSVRTIPIASLLANDTNGPGSESVQALAFSLVAFSAIGGTVDNDATNVFFTPAANFKGFASFRYRLSDNGAANPENDTSTVSFNITEVADTPSVSNATTFINQQTTSGLVIARNPADGTAVTHFKITNIVNGTLFKSNGTTPINANDFIASFEGSGGLKFTPAAGLTSPGSTFSFDVQGSTSNSDAGLGTGIATATITVHPGQTFVVNTLGDAPDLTLNGACDSDAAAGNQCTLRAAIQETNNLLSPDTITFDPALNGNSIVLNSALDLINGNLAINGPGANLLTVMRSTAGGTPKFRVFRIISGAKLAISGLTVSNGLVPFRGDNGGGILNEGSLTLTDCNIYGNSAGTENGFGQGGGIYSEGPSLVLHNCNIGGTAAGQRNTSGANGGGITAYGSLLMTGGSIVGNSESGIFIGGTAKLVGVTVTNNAAPSHAGGGIRVVGTSAFATIVDCVIANNIAATGGGGGISSALATVTVINSTVSGNVSSSSGGGVDSFNVTQTTLINTTVTNNRSNNGSGGGLDNSGPVLLRNTIVAGNFGGASPSTIPNDVSDLLDTNSSSNLIGSCHNCGLTNGVNGNQIGVANPGLGPLADNGGPTFTHPLLAGSPAIDAGDNSAVTNPPFSGPPFTDQRVSFSRIVDGDSNGTTIVDIGAYERQGNLIDTVNPPAGRTSGGQEIVLAGAFANLSTVTIGGTSALWFYTNGNLDTSSITVTTPAHAVGAVQIDLTSTSGSVYSRANAVAYLPTSFTDNTILVGQTTAKAQHIIELRQAVDALRAVAGLTPAPWTDPSLAPFSTIIKPVHILELRLYLDDAAARLGYATSPYTDPSLGTGFIVKRIHIEELRQRIRTIAG